MNENMNPKLYGVARAAYAVALDHIPENFRQSLPIPILKNKKAYLVFLYYQSTIRYNKPTVVFAPTWIQTVDCDSGEVVDWRKIVPGEFGKDFKVGEIGEFVLPPNMTAEQYKENEQELYRVLTELLPAFQIWNPKTEIDKERSKKYTGLFDKISEPPLRPFYEAVGYNFNHWLKQ